jgi:hypothetical protein
VLTELVNREEEAGYYSLAWDASSVASGVYFARLTITDQNGIIRYRKLNKMQVMK